MALILITHDMAVVAETAQRVVVQYAGQQAEVQDARGLFDDPKHPYTEALLAALPERATTRRLATIPGVVPGAGDRPSGCLFHLRCRYATEYCVRNEPPLADGPARQGALPLPAHGRRAGALPGPRGRDVMPGLGRRAHDPPRQVDRDRHPGGLNRYCRGSSRWSRNSRS